jgi:hypothetical protein
LGLLLWCIIEKRKNNMAMQAHLLNTKSAFAEVTALIYSHCLLKVLPQALLHPCPWSFILDHLQIPVKIAKKHDYVATQKVALAMASGKLKPTTNGNTSHANQ